MNYIEPARLAELIEQAQAGDFSNELVKAVLTMGANMRADYDAVGNALIKIWQNINRIDTSRNVFAYITTVIRSQQGMLNRLYERDRKAKLGYYFRVMTDEQQMDQGQPNDNKLHDSYSGFCPLKRANHYLGPSAGWKGSKGK